MSPGNCCRPLTASYTGSQAPPPVTLSCSLLNPYWPQFFLKHTTNTSSSSPLYLASPLPGKFSAHITVWFTPSLSSFFFFKCHFREAFQGFPSSSAGKESTCNAGDPGSTPRLGKCSGEGKGYPLQYSGLENPMDCIVHGVSNGIGHNWVTFTFTLKVIWSKHLNSHFISHLLALFFSAAFYHLLPLYILCSFSYFLIVCTQ